MRVPLERLKQYVAVTATAKAIGVRLTMGGLEVEGIEASVIGAGAGRVYHAEPRATAFRWSAWRGKWRRCTICR